MLFRREIRAFNLDSANPGKTGSFSLSKKINEQSNPEVQVDSCSFLLPFRDADANLEIRPPEILPFTFPMSVLGPEEGEITQLLARWKNGEPSALENLVPLVYPHLREIATAHIRRERTPGVMQATSLVHELYLRLLAQKKADWKGRAHFYTFSSKIMRLILIDSCLRTRRLRALGDHADRAFFHFLAQPQSLDGGFIEAQKHSSLLSGGSWLCGITQALHRPAGDFVYVAEWEDHAAHYSALTYELMSKCCCYWNP